VSTDPTAPRRPANPTPRWPPKPSASTGVSGSDSSARTALANCQTACRGRPGQLGHRAGRFPLPGWRCRAAAPPSVRRPVGGNILRTCSIDMACQLVDRRRQRGRCAQYPSGHQIARQQTGGAPVVTGPARARARRAPSAAIPMPSRRLRSRSRAGSPIWPPERVQQPPDAVEVAQDQNRPSRAAAPRRSLASRLALRRRTKVLVQQPKTRPPRCGPTAADRSVPRRAQCRWTPSAMASDRRKRGCSSPRSSTRTEINSRPARRASPAHPRASGSCVGPISASTASALPCRTGGNRMPAHAQASFLQQQLGAVPRG